MQKILPMLLFALVANISLLAQSAKETPLIDREVLFGNPEISGGQLSPDGKFISFLKAYNGIMNIWVKKFDEPFEKARRLTNLTRPSAGYFWTYDGKYIVYANDKGGNENFNIFAVDPAAPADASTSIPLNRNLTPLDSVTVYIYLVSKNDPNVMLVGLNNRDPKWHDLYKLEINSGKLTLMQENKNRIAGWVFDWSEKPRLALRNPEDGSTEFLSLDNNQPKKIYSVTAMEAAAPLSFTKDNKMVYVQTNKGDNVDLTKLVLMNPATGAVTDVEQDPLKRVDLETVSFSDISKEIIYTSYYDDKERLYFKDKKYEADYNLLKSKYPGFEIGIASSTKDERKWLFSVSGDTKVPTVYFFDRDSKKIIEQYTPRPKLKKYEAYLSPMKPIRYKSSDGLEIPGYITLPKNKVAKNLPLLVFPHGGPWGRSTWGFNSFAQLFANRGFVVLDPNFRASTGYGKKFLNAGNLQWGKLMQDDITWGVKYLVEKGIVDPKRVAIMGGSYGGYATLAGLAFTPDVYAAGVDIVGPSNLFTLLSTIPSYWESFRKIFELRMGDDKTEKGKAILKAASPLFSADKIKAPLMIIQGANDPRVKKAESDQIVIAMRNLGRDVQYILAEDEGHGFRKPVNNMAMIAASEKFLAKYLGTRYQEDMPNEVAKRLNEMTVDIKTVKLAEKPMAKSMKAMPALSKDLSDGKFNYDVSIAVNGQTVPMEMTRTIKADGTNWNVLDEAKGGFGTMSDASLLNGKDLSLMKRTVVQGPVTVTMINEPGKVSIEMGGKNTSLNTDALVISDGAALDLIVARMPLAAGYKTSFKTVDAASMTLKELILEVSGMEMQNNVNCWKVTLVNSEQANDKIVLWIDPQKLLGVKMEQTIPALNNAVMTAVLK